MDPPLLLDVKDLEEVRKEVTEVKLKRIVIPKVEQHEVQLLGPEAEFTAAVGMSRQWDARAAGREVAENTLKKLNGKKPDFFLLFTTIHYEKHGGFQELLNGAWEVLPEGTPLIGGTIAGFMNPEGCYTRGATAMAVNYPNMDVAIGIGHNTKRAPKLAAKECANAIKRAMPKNGFSTAYIFSLISGGLVPQVLGIGRKKVFQGLLGRIGELMFAFSLTILQKGVGREEEVLESFIDELSEYSMLQGSSMDNGKAMSNYQFINKQVTTNSIVALGIKTDFQMDIVGLNQLKAFKTFSVDKLSSDKRIIKRINGLSGTEGFLNLLGWPKEYFNDRLFTKTFFFPLGFKRGTEWIATVVGIVLGNSLVVLHRTKTSDMAILSADGKTIMNSIDESIKKFENKEISFYMVSTCDAILEGLGSQNFKVYDKLLNSFGETPFVLAFCGGEGIYKPNQDFRYGNVTFNIAGFWKK